ncbi:MAG: DUF2892 domain-containing protein [Clostridia bacterium]|jgi:hypothetical protein|nr:DUF2892 domain-containing protein [Clostridia bacterium]MCI2000357.1 DUF2892 domain-containing protein [Clostridia bacterium]MCI2015537.1 DUF2892 domain-containing protein [Clostridia bacterium]
MIKKIFPPTTKKEAFYTCSKFNKKIRDDTINCINKYKDCDELTISEKLNNLNYEWDTERVLETNAATVVFLSSVLGLCKRRYCCFLLTGIIGICLLNHALFGWCPPLPIIRKMGVRTAEEINNEKTVFKLIRGDFSQDTKNAAKLLNIAEKQ